MEIISLLSQAGSELDRLDMFSDYIPHIDIFISMHVLKEVTQSSKTEGTQTNMRDALLDKEDIPLDKRDEWQEVHNCIHAMESAIKEFETLPSSSRLIREIHKVHIQGKGGT